MTAKINVLIQIVNCLQKIHAGWKRGYSFFIFSLRFVKDKGLDINRLRFISKNVIIYFVLLTDNCSKD